MLSAITYRKKYVNLVMQATSLMLFANYNKS